jgi:hypothetical protein
MGARAYAKDEDPTITTGPVAHDGQLFNVEEMQAIREQYEEALEEERGRREELEWQVRMALAAVRDAELDARRSADQLQKVQLTLQALLVGREPVEPPRPQPPPRPTAPRATAKIGGPPPIPPKTSMNRSGPLPPRDLVPFKPRVA